MVSPTPTRGCGIDDRTFSAHTHRCVTLLCVRRVRTTTSLFGVTQSSDRSSFHEREIEGMPGPSRPRPRARRQSAIMSIDQIVLKQFVNPLVASLPPKNPFTYVCIMPGYCNCNIHSHTLSASPLFSRVSYGTDSPTCHTSRVIDTTHTCRAHLTLFVCACARLTLRSPHTCFARIARIARISCCSFSNASLCPWSRTI